MLDHYLLGQRLKDAQESQNKVQANQQVIEEDKLQVYEAAKNLCEKPLAPWIAFAGGAAVGYLTPKTHLSLLSVYKTFSLFRP